jgi:hypothetical protein
MKIILFNKSGIPLFEPNPSTLMHIEDNGQEDFGIEDEASIFFQEFLLKL